MNARSGLSLFELLIALALLALIAVGLTGAVSFAVSVYDRARLDPEHYEQIALKTRLRSWLSNASPASGITPYPVNFVGEVRRLEFTTTHSKGFASEAAALRVLVENNAGNLVVIASGMDDDGDLLAVHTATIATGIDPVFSYFDAQSENPAWAAEWVNVARLPDLVRIESTKGAPSNWHTLIVKPLLN
ncbi:prepilin-type N-terminal cleavage/methylation domain-containing protein [Ruegeria arenilitoris]|uniref:prepilin-type N-terminal cleavage/methylation domain-containing protein n=1 Tax=Ruegeria arenilitoris TaxID=1173585 RepID=UPI00147C8CE4|nr:prepilin-type N-terminal cleavage/methylation domain-containing protein [Ruegeria arenilitoris]